MLTKSFPDTTPKNSLGYSLTRVHGETWGSLETAPLGGLVLIFLFLAKLGVDGHFSLSRRLGIGLGTSFTSSQTSDSLDY